MPIRIEYLFFAMVVSITGSQCKMDTTISGNADPYLVIDTSQIERFPIDCSIRAIEAIDARTLWFAGTRGMYGYTKDSGATWHIDSLSHPGHEELQFRSMAVTKEAVFLLSIGSPAVMFRSTDNGTNWDIVYEEYDSLAFYDAMAFWDENEGLAMGDPTDGCLSVIKTIDGGNSWNKFSCNLLPKTYAGEAAFAASNSNIALFDDQAWIVSGGKKARVFHSGDRGKSWKVFETPVVQGGQMTGIYSVDFFDANNGIIIGGDWNDKAMNTQTKAITTDGGVTWNLIADGEDPGYRSCVQYLNSSNSNVIMAVGIPGISLSTDGGVNWNDISNESFYTVRIAGNTIWMAGNNKIARVPIRYR